MRRTYVAYGLQVAATFPLVGMAPDEMPSLPVLAVDLADCGRLDSTWSGSTGELAWQGRLGDGRTLAIERGVAGDVMYTYGDRARFRFDRSASRIECAPLREGLEWQRVLLGKVLPSASVMLGYEALHAGVADCADGVVALLGPSGAGKSTLLAEFLGRGWSLFADDELTLGDREGGVRAYPGTPHMNVAANAPISADVTSLGTTLSTFSGERWLVAGRRTSRPRPVRAICMLNRARGAPLEVRRVPASPISVAPYMLGLSTDSGRIRARFRIYADLAEQCTFLQLTGDLDSPPQELADTLQRALDHAERGG